LKTSRYFATLIETYRTDMQGLAVDFEGRQVLDRRLTEKRKGFASLLPLAVEMPELAAPALHRAFAFTTGHDAERLLLDTPGRLPAWATVRSMLTIQSWAQPLIEQALKIKGGETFLVIAALLDHAYLVADKTAAPETEEGSSDEDGKGRRESGDSDGDDGEDQGDLSEAGGAWLEQQGFDRLEQE
jgi:hypothetical protein